MGQRRTNPKKKLDGNVRIRLDALSKLLVSPVDTLEDMDQVLLKWGQLCAATRDLDWSQSLISECLTQQQQEWLGEALYLGALCELLDRPATTQVDCRLRAKLELLPDTRNAAWMLSFLTEPQKRRLDEVQPESVIRCR